MQRTIVLGGGCFWCVEAVFNRVKGVESVVPGYAGGTVPDPTYYQVCTGNTGHAEVIKATFDDASISLDDILDIFFAAHDPTTKDRQGHDIGTQYRSIILFSHESDILNIHEALRRAQAVWGFNITTEIKKLDSFWPAEQEHIGYYQRYPNQPYCMAVISPKLTKLMHGPHASKLNLS